MNPSMLVLGIESSCDETAAAVVEDGARIRANVVASQVLTHEKYGGVVPELASREHLRKIDPVVEAACREAQVALGQIDAIAVTEGPGLIGSLLVGLVYGKALALALGKPLVGVNHLEGHIYAVRLENRMARAQSNAMPEATVPAIALVVSGGHTSLFRVEAGAQSLLAAPLEPLPHGRSSDAAGVAAGRLRCFLLGRTRDDAAGEAFDKVAKLLALGYPGGPIIETLACFGDPQAVEFGAIRMKGNALDFSFAGLKTAVLYRVRGSELEDEAEARRKRRCDHVRPTAEELRAQCSQDTLDLVSSFQHAVIEDLVGRTLAAAERHGGESVWVSGGVASNGELRRRFQAAGQKEGFPVFFPSPALSTDNAAMIAAAGYEKVAAGERAGLELTAHASLPLGASP